MAKSTVVVSTRIPRMGPGVTKRRVDALALKLGLVKDDGAPNQSQLVMRALEEFVERNPVDVSDESPPRSTVRPSIVDNVRALPNAKSAHAVSPQLTRWERTADATEKAGFCDTTQEGVDSSPQARRRTAA